MGNEKSEHNCYEKQHTQNLSLQQSKHEAYFDASNEDPNKDPDFGEKILHYTQTFFSCTKR